MPPTSPPRPPRRPLGRGPWPWSRPPHGQEAPAEAPEAPVGAAAMTLGGVGEPDGSDAPDDAAAPEPEHRASGTAGEKAPARQIRPERPEPAPEPAPETGPGRPGPAPAPEPAGEATSTPGPAGEAPPAERRFTLRLANFEGPFDLLLQLIARHKLDVTEIALSRVTDEFMAHIRALGDDFDLDQTTEFLVVAATLLDLKAARLLPAAAIEDEADLALLEARDLLFARLLQYRAYKRIAALLDERLAAEGRRHPRTVGLEPHHAALLPEVVISIGAEGFARLAAGAMRPRPKPEVYVDHIHAPLVSVREQAEAVVALLRERGRASFRELAEGAGDTLTVVARFLALLELYRDRAVALDQAEALGELLVTWTGGEGAAVVVTDEFDRAPDAVEDPA